LPQADPDVWSNAPETPQVVIGTDGFGSGDPEDREEGICARRDENAVPARVIVGREQLVEDGVDWLSKNRVLNTFTSVTSSSSSHVTCSRLVTDNPSREASAVEIALRSKGWPTCRETYGADRPRGCHCGWESRDVLEQKLTTALAR
jgi:hypothetical protein